MKERGRFEVLLCPGPFNYSAINNRAVQQARGEIVGLLNNDIEVTHPEWLGEMVSHAVRAGIGAVGAKLFYPDFCIQHAGVITGLGGVAGHAFKGFSRDEPGMQFRPHLAQNLSAVTAACLVIRKSTYLRAGGLDEKELAVAFNDVDFCLKVEALGFRNLYTPFAEFFHRESASRGAEDDPEKIRRFQSEIAVMKARWGDRLLNDPAYNPNLSLDSEDFAFAYPPRVPPLSDLTN
jgi:GT2 family glycosyltransferase